VVAGETDIRTRLLKFDFNEEFSGETHPPATHYHLGGDDSGFYAEFLTPLIGAAHNRKQRRKTTVEVAGTSTQQLSYSNFFCTNHGSLISDTKNSPRGFKSQTPSLLLRRKS
jgi:hypothetical protein